jgi:hypothetical protein
MEELMPELKELVFALLANPTSFHNLCLVSRSWAMVGRRAQLQASAKRRLARSSRTQHRSTQWDVDTLLWHLPNGRRHGFERVAVTPHRVGGPGCPVYYAERMWVDGARDGDEIVWQINIAQEDGAPSTYRVHPYEGLGAVLAWEEEPEHASEVEAAARAYNSGTMPGYLASDAVDYQAMAKATLGRWERWGVMVMWRRWGAGQLLWRAELLSEGLEAFGVLGALEGEQ